MKHHIAGTAGSVLIPVANIPYINVEPKGNSLYFGVSSIEEAHAIQLPLGMTL